MNKAQQQLLLLRGAAFVFGLILQHNRNPKVRKFGKDIDRDVEDDFFDDFL